ncbi:hypothetical protein ACNOYE_25700 [Nannocystaceae bacterium ST9]
MSFLLGVVRDAWRQRPGRFVPEASVSVLASNVARPLDASVEQAGASEAHHPPIHRTALERTSAVETREWTQSYDRSATVERNLALIDPIDPTMNRSGLDEAAEAAAGSTSRWAHQGSVFEFASREATGSEMIESQIDEETPKDSTIRARIAPSSGYVGSAESMASREYDDVSLVARPRRAEAAADEASLEFACKMAILQASSVDVERSSMISLGTAMRGEQTVPGGPTERGESARRGEHATSVHGGSPSASDSTGPLEAEPELERRPSSSPNSRPAAHVGSASPEQRRGLDPNPPELTEPATGTRSGAERRPSLSETSSPHLQRERRDPIPRMPSSMVHIGHVEVFIAAPPTNEPVRGPEPAPWIDGASRRYLRRP